MAFFVGESSNPQRASLTAAWEKIMNVIHGLDDSLLELGDVRNMLTNDTMPATDLLVGARRLSKMVEELISNIKADPEIQKVLPVPFLEDFAAAFPLIDPKMCTFVVPGAQACMRRLGSEASKRVAVEKHASCDRRSAFDPDPSVWSSLPEHLLGLVLAKLPLPQLFLVPRLSRTWLTTSKTPGFGALCADNPHTSKLFGIVSFHPDVEEFRLTAFDVKTLKWYHHALDKVLSGSLAVNYWNPIFTHDGGLVCFVSNNADSIVVGNPLTNRWKRVPLIHRHGKKVPFLVQLVRNVQTGFYRVKVVFGGRSTEGNFAADVYDSQTGTWTTLRTGHVCASQFALVFDCQQGILFDKSNELIPPLEGDAECYAAVGDSIFVMHESTHPRRLNHYNITEFAWENSTSSYSRRLKSFNCPLPKAPECYQFLVFASKHFILTVANLGDSYDPYHNQVMMVCDPACEAWHEVPVLKCEPDGRAPPTNLFRQPDRAYSTNMLRQEFLGDTFLCDLRWDAFP